MTKFSTFVGSALLLIGCASTPEKSRVCFAKEPSISPTTTGEIKALRFVERRRSKGCNLRGIECNLQLRHEPDGNIAITATRAWLEGNPPECMHPEGGFETYLFTPEGKLIHVVLGI